VDSLPVVSALSSGAEFVVTPVCKTETHQDRARSRSANHDRRLHSNRTRSWLNEAGADYVKIFPADTLGPGYMKSLRAPLPHLRLVPTGGVDVQNVGDFLRAGCVALGVGSSLVSAKILQTGDWPELTRKAAEFVAAARRK
jgi:2-dehydro-3-deoxyphosphogluconate aldolase/(4S)-4-hydroxy-2-oxoglutarate aldolase